LPRFLLFYFLKFFLTFCNKQRMNINKCHKTPQNNCNKYITFCLSYIYRDYFMSLRWCSKFDCLVFLCLLLLRSMLLRHRRSRFGRRAFSVAGPMVWNLLIISVIHRSASNLLDQHWRHSFSQCTGTRSAVEALYVMRYTSGQSSSSSSSSTLLPIWWNEDEFCSSSLKRRNALLILIKTCTNYSGQSLLLVHCRIFIMFGTCVTEKASNQ